MRRISISAWKLGGLGFKELGTRVWADIQRDALFDRAAQLSYFFLLAFFPLLICLTAVLGLFAQDTTLRENMLASLARVTPPAAFELVSKTLNEISRSAGGGKLSLALAGAVWAASSGIGAIMDGLNMAYKVKDTRPWWKIKLVAIGLTIASSLFVLVALSLVLYGGEMGGALAGRLGLENLFVALWDIAIWPVALGLVLLAFVLLYRFAPDLEIRTWRWSWPGAVVGCAIWLAASLGFRVYLRYFNSYNATYGSLGAVIILMLWFYITGLAILIGAEVNSDIENAAAQRGDPEARRLGQKVLPAEISAN